MSQHRWASSTTTEKIYNEWSEELDALKKVRDELPKILIENDMLKKELKACQEACKEKDKEIARLSSIATEIEKAEKEKNKTNVKF